MKTSNKDNSLTTSPIGIAITIRLTNKGFTSRGTRNAQIAIAKPNKKAIVIDRALNDQNQLTKGSTAAHRSPNCLSWRFEGFQLGSSSAISLIQLKLSEVFSAFVCRDTCFLLRL